MSPQQRAFARPALRPYLPDLRFCRTVGAGVCVLCSAGRAGVRRAVRAVLGEAPKKPTTADRVDRAGQAALVAVVALAATGGAVAAAWHQVGPYGPWLAGVGLLVLLGAACAAAPPPKPVTPPEPPAAEPVAPREEIVRTALLQYLEALTRGRNGIHLGELHQHLTRTAAYATLARPQVGPLLEAHGIPTVRSMTVDGVSGRTGVRRAAVEALLSPGLQAPSREVSLPLSPLVTRGFLDALSDDSRSSESPVSGR